LGMFSDAVDTTTKGLSLYPADPKLWNNKGYGLFKLGRYGDAISAYDQALAVEQDSSQLSKYWTNKGDALAASGKYQEAADAYQKALTYNPSNTIAAEGLTKTQGKITPYPMVFIIGVIAVVLIGGVAVYYLLKRKGTNASKEK
jgi:tetratricopeptide (TPR) repeat protein